MPNSELTGELYARWFQFAAFCGSFRSHGRTWWTRLPWGWGLGEMGPREHNNTNAPIPPDDRRNILRVGAEQSGHRAGRQEVRRAALPAAALHLHAGVGSARSRPAADAGDVAALSRRRARPRAGHAVPVGPRSAGRAGVHQGGDVARGLPARGRLVRLVDERESDRRRHRHAAGRSRDDADLCPRRRDRPRRSGPAVHRAAGHRADDAQGLHAAPTASSRSTTTTASARTTWRGGAAGSG